MMEKELDWKLTLGMAETKETESPHDEESWGGDQCVESRSDAKSISFSESGYFLFNRSQYGLGIR